MAPSRRADLEAGTWINIALGLAVAGIALLSHDVTPLLLWGSIVGGILIIGLAAYEATRWGALPRARLVSLSAASAILGAAVVLGWAANDENKSIRPMLIVLGALVALVGIYGAWRTSQMTREGVVSP